MNTHDPSRPRASEAPGDDVERLLASFAPRPSRLDRDRLMFLAGQAAAAGAVNPVVASVERAERRPRTPWYWPASTVASTLCATVMCVVLVNQSPDVPRGAPTALTPDEAPARSPSPPSRSGAPTGVAIVEAPAPDAAPVEDDSPRLDAVAADRFRRLRDAADRPSLDELPPAGSSVGDAGPPSTYLRAVRSVIDRPQSLSLGLRY